MTTCPMEPVDAAWYHMDGPANPAVVTALLVTAEPLPFEKFRDAMLHRLCRIARFRERVVEQGFPLPTPHWQEDPDFDADRHLHHIALPAPGDRRALESLVGDLASQPVPHDRPLWQAHLIDGVGEGSAVVMRYHHCLADGVAMMAVAGRLLDKSRKGSKHRGATEEAFEPPSAEAGWLGSAFSAIEDAARSLADAAASALKLAADPAAVGDRAATTARGAGMLVAELLRSPDPQSPLKGEFTDRQRVAWSRPIAVDQVKAVGAPFHAHVNDVLVAALAGALRRYLERRGVNVNHTTVRAMVPVNLRPLERMNQLGNDFGLVILDLPVQMENGMERLMAAQKRMSALKHSPEPLAMQLLLDLFGRGPKPLQQVAQWLFGSKASLVLTNVIGPHEPLYLAGVPVKEMMFWVPHPGDELGMGVSIMSYRGEAVVSFIADATLVPEPSVLVEDFEKEFDTMHQHVEAAYEKLVQRTKGAAQR